MFIGVHYATGLQSYGSTSRLAVCSKQRTQSRRLNAILRISSLSSRLSASQPCTEQFHVWPRATVCWVNVKGSIATAAAVVHVAFENLA